MVRTRRQVENILQAEWDIRHRRPSRAAVTRLVEDTGKTEEFVNEWFIEKRKEHIAAQRAAPVVRAAVRRPAARPRVRPAPPVIVVAAPAPVNPIPLFIPLPRVVVPRNADPVAPAILRQADVNGPALLPNNQMAVQIRHEVGRTIQVRLEQANQWWPPRFHITLPGPNTCYPDQLVNDFAAANPDDDITNDDLEVFKRVLHAKIRCQICYLGMITLKCTECSNGICNGCALNIAGATPAFVAACKLDCPHCRHGPQPFVPVANLRM